MTEPVLFLLVLISQAPPALWPMPGTVNKIEAVDQYCTGVVLGLTKDSITIRPDRQGQPRTFTPSLMLATGSYSAHVAPSCMYKLSDVNIGDYIGIDYDRINGVDICKSVGIRRRPGGKIPPGHYPPDLKDPPHERAQAYQDFEERGTPLPAKYQSPARSEFAPPPREVNPKP